MTDAAGMRAIVATAAARFDADLGTALPSVAPALRRWLGGNVAAFAETGLVGDGFPALPLPFWADGEAPDEALHADLAYATLNGFCFIRLIDDVADGDRPDERRRLLPACGFFHSRFQAAYQRLFAPDDAFWPLFHGAWDEQANASAGDAQLADVTAGAFAALSSRKFSAARIPVAAVLHRRGAAADMPRWAAFVDRLGAFCQMANDVLGWQLDLQNGIRTRFLSEFGRQRLSGEPFGAWYRRVGLAWASDWLTAALNNLEEDAPAEAARHWLGVRRRALGERLQLLREIVAFVPDDPAIAGSKS